MVARGHDGGRRTAWGHKALGRGGWVIAWGATLVALVMALGLGEAVLAAVALSPARIEVEVGPAGIDKDITIVNRGDRPMDVEMYVGYGGHDAWGGPVYYDDEGSLQAAATWVHVLPKRFTLDPGAWQHVRVHFAPLPGAHAAYPVIFAETRPAIEGSGSRVDGPNEHVPPSLRIGVPVLASFADTRSEHVKDTVIRSVSARAVPDDDRLIVDVVVENVGTVHASVQPQITAVDAHGNLIERVLLPPGRLLPGLIRHFRGEWPLSHHIGTARLAASLMNEAEASPVFVAVTWPETIDSVGDKDRQVAIVSNVP